MTGSFRSKQDPDLLFDLRIVEQAYERLFYGLLEFGSLDLVRRSVGSKIVHPALCARPVKTPSIAGIVLNYGT